MSIETLINKGCVTFNLPEHIPTERTIVVVGTARGGTSIAAGTLNHLGVAMFGAHAPVFEDINLSTAFESKDAKKYTKIIKKYNKEAVWAWKRPSSLGYLDLVETEIRNPFYVVVVRDALSVGARNGLSMGHDVVASMKATLAQQETILDFVSTTKSPVMMVSVEKVKQYPQSFVESLVSFSGVSPDENQIESAINFIEPEPMEYIEASRINRSHGQIGGIKNGFLYGWGCWMYRPEAVEIELSINNELMATTLADEMRTHAKGKANMRDGLCGYRFNLSDYNLSPGDKISVQVKGEVRDLKKSPITLNQSHLNDVTK